jgi:hypothetical protein
MLCSKPTLPKVGRTFVISIVYFSTAAFGGVLSVTSCGITTPSGSQSSTGAQVCGVGNVGASAGASTSYGFGNLTATATGLAGGIGVGGPFFGSDATAAIENDYFVTTGGPVRPGFLVYFADGGQVGILGHAFVLFESMQLFVVGPSSFSAECPAADGICTIPITLGQHDLVSLKANAEGESTIFDNELEQSQASVSFNIVSFLEADGTTPVSYTVDENAPTFLPNGIAVPEPAQATMFFVGILLIGLRQGRLDMKRF